MERSKISELRTLIGRLVIVGAIAIAGYFLYQHFFGGEKGPGYEIEDTPLHVEEIRKIVELNTIKFRDEVVVDSLELYKNTAEQIQGNLQKLMDPDQAKHGISSSNVKRRLTMVVKGELLYGIDLKRKDFTVMPKDGKLVISLPHPELLSINLTPKNTDIFVENGVWKDYERQLLMRKARSKMIKTGEKLRLPEKAKAPLERLLKQLIRSNMPIVIEYY
jgi:Protein of unknown function (DUF4230)